MTPPLNAPTTLLVVPAWLKLVLGTDVGAATELPESNEWHGPSKGFVTVTMAGGDENPYLPQSEPVVQLDVYATSTDSSKPLWYAAQNICSAIVDAVRPRMPNGSANPYFNVTLPLSVKGKSYGSARVMEAGGSVLTAPTRAYGSAEQYAHMIFDVSFVWTVVAYA